MKKKEKILNFKKGYMSSFTVVVLVFFYCIILTSATSSPSPITQAPTGQPTGQFDSQMLELERFVSSFLYG